MKRREAGVWLGWRQNAGFYGCGRDGVERYVYVVDFGWAAGLITEEWG